MIIRPITDSDLPAVLEVYRQSEDFLALGPDPHASPEMVEKDRELSRQEGGVYCGIFLENPAMNLAGFENPSGLAARDGGQKNLTGSGTNLSGEELQKNLTGSNANLSGSMGELVGILDYTPGCNGDPCAAFIELLMIAAPQRGRGLGEQAVYWLVSTLGGEAGLLKLCAAVQVNNPNAMRFWQHMGFHITGPAERQPDSTITYPIEAIIKRGP